MEKPMLKIKIGEGEQSPQEDFNHDDHMAKIQEGLQQILASNDINQIKQIAQNLLSEEQKEESVEEKAEPFNFKEKAMGVLNGANSAGA